MLSAEFPVTTGNRPSHRMVTKVLSPENEIGRPCGEL